MCRCGNRGCLETTASTSVLLGVLASTLERPCDTETWVRLAKDGHTAAVRLMEDCGRHVGAAVANLCNFINPAKVILGGPVTAAGELLLGPVRDEVRRRAMPAASATVSVEISRHGPRSEVFGALCLAIQAASATSPAAFKD
jgi:predicted NBD/HSP70 family sugar kinase